MWRKWYTWVLLVVLGVSLICWMDTELKILDSVGNNEAWTELSNEENQTSNGLAVSAMKQLLIDSDNLTSEQRFANLMVMARCYLKGDYKCHYYYELYWLAISDTKVDDIKTNETVEATRRLISGEKDFDQKLTYVSTVLDYVVSDKSELSDFGFNFRYYIDNRFVFENVLLEKIDYRTLLVSVDRTWEYLWIVSLMAFLGLMYMSMFSRASKKKMANNQEVGK